MVFPPGSGSPAVSSQYPAIIWQWPCSCSAWWEAVHLADVASECVVFVSSSRRKRLHIFWLQTYCILCASCVLHSYFEVTFNVCWCQHYSTEVLMFYENVLQATINSTRRKQIWIEEKLLSFCRPISGCQPDTASLCASSLKIKQLLDASKLQLQLVWPIVCWWRRQCDWTFPGC
jgi:hypothetical protein